jgi:DNA topoisomerase IB
MKEVSHYLGNTPAVCRSSYVDPRIVDRYQAGVTISGVVERLAVASPSGRDPLTKLDATEAAVLELLDEAPPVETRAAS